MRHLIKYRGKVYKLAAKAKKGKAVKSPKHAITPFKEMAKLPKWQNKDVKDFDESFDAAIEKQTIDKRN